MSLQRLITLLLFIVTACGAKTVSAQCSVSNPGGCTCPSPGGPNCLLIPDIIAGKKTLNGTAGWSEYLQSAAAPNKGLLRIDVATPNVGWGPIEVISTDNYLCGTDTLFGFIPPSGFLCPDGSYPKRLIKQRLYQKNGNTFTYVDRDAGWMVYHPAHGHIHIEGWGLYTLRLRDVTVTDTLQWPIVNSGVKVSFCLIDLTTCSGSNGDCVDANGNILTNGNFPNYGLAGGYGCNNFRQGISVGRVDIYDRGLDESFVRIPYEACNGTYHMVVQIDPDNHFLELNENNNWLAAPIPLTKQRTANTGPYSYIFSKKGNTVCTGGSLTLQASGANTYLWSTGATSQNITVTSGGKYWVRATTPCGTTTSDTLNISVSGTSGFPAVTSGDTVCVGERAHLYASGNAHWYDAPTGGNLVFIGNNYETGNLLGTTTYYVTDQPSVLAGRVGPSTTTFSGAGNLTGGASEYLIFNAFLPFKLKKLTVNAGSAGMRTIQLRDQYGHMLQQQNVNLVAGTQEIVLDFFVPAGLNHQLGLSTATPTTSLYRSITTNSNIGFPFKLNSVANIVGSSAGDAAYPYFYNWDVEVTSEACNLGQRKPVTAVATPKPPVVIWGLASQYHYFATAVHLSGTPAGGIFTGTGVINGVFYPRIAGIGAHIITYTVDNGSCVSQDAKQTLVTMDATNLPGGFTVQLFDNPGTQPMLWVVTLEASPIEITLLNETGQTLQTWIKSVNPGTNNIYLDVTRYPKALYFLRVFHAATGKTMTLKMVN